MHSLALTNNNEQISVHTYWKSENSLSRKIAVCAIFHLGMTCLFARFVFLFGFFVFLLCFFFSPPLLCVVYWALALTLSLRPTDHSFIRLHSKISLLQIHSPLTLKLALSSTIYSVVFWLTNWEEQRPTKKKMNIFYAIFFCVCCSLLCSITFNWTNKTMENADVCELCMLLLVLLLGVIWKWLFALPKGRLCRRNRQWLCSVSFRFIVCSAQHLFALSRFQHSRTKNIISVVRERVCKRARLCSVWTCIKMQ